MIIRLFALDVDGTLTDGGVYLDGSGSEYKRFDVRDGMGFALLRRAGVEIAWISGRFSAATARRASELQVFRLFNGVEEKLPALQALTEELGISLEETAYMGDDVNDLACLRSAGLALAPSDAVEEVRSAADMVTPSRAGHGAVRDAAEFILAHNRRAAP